MKIVHKKLEYSKPWSFPDVYLFTGNPILNKEGELVMGRGAAAEVKENYPETPAGLARSTNPVMRFSRIQNDQWVGVLMVKKHWKEKADPKMIERAFRHLRIASECSLTLFSLRFHCNFPGIGNGGLSFEEVKDVIERVKLPDNIVLYKHPK